ncbi:MAG: penicillin-binding protein, partial [Clostridia bacterium]|nr:penicillin-binding protein [Clostridia bacterium]
MENTIKISRYIALGLFVAGILMFYALQLMTMQIVEGEEHLEAATYSTTQNITVHAARGEIVDRYGRALARNRMGYSVVLDKAAFDLDHINSIILQLNKLLSADEQCVDLLPLEINSAGVPSFPEDKEK